MRMVRFALNHMVAPRLGHAAFFDLAGALGIDAIEIRNDLQDVAILDGTPAARIAEDARSRGLSVRSINALQRFNEWSPVRAEEARALADYAAGCGAAALVLCPVNGGNWQLADSARLSGLREALEGLAPILEAAGIEGLVEPLGFPECSLRLKREAVDAIDDVGVSNRFRLVHDTFHHAVAGEAEIFPARTGLVHISGVADRSSPVSALRDPHRVLIGGDDRIDNIGQIRALVAGGYQGYFSFEPFAKEIHEINDIEGALRASLAYVDQELRAAAA
ncbi:xylose isomerase [Kaistia algarum]|uniref:TIM barrel protein n=1 Tax=Kaistia algarum TaxID=2083279 RepID=UPI000CE7F890|nr:TIM barrel protein [Kaistia algarum]MCX5515862.1 TIM barrel protein [Kaistia algarum]PPE80772.1 xylose isomerase [Kaistia algarum]